MNPARSRFSRFFRLFLALTFTVLLSCGAYGASKGWQKSGNKVYFYTGSGSSLKKVTGYKKIGKYYYLFSSKGVLRTGWVQMSDGVRYFRTTGDPGKLGRQYTGLKEINGRLFGFDKNTGLLLTGLKEVDSKTYYFKKKGGLGVKGRAFKNMWITVGGKKRYFGSDCVMATNTWVKDTYYVGSDGGMLKSTYTPDGYEVDSSGKKTGKKIGGWTKKNGKWYYYSLKRGEFLKKTWIKSGGKMYYVDKNGVRVTGFVSIGSNKYYLDPETGEVRTGAITIKGKDYYFGSDGKLLVSGSSNGYKTNQYGIITKRPKYRILIVPGHNSSNDSGAVGIGSETEYTRIFSKLLVSKLRKVSRFTVDYFLNGDTSYSMYSLHCTYLDNNGVKVTGSGANREKVLKALRSHSLLADLSLYDYVLEIHFNATAVASKDLTGNGTCKGLGFYVDTTRVAKNDLAVEKQVTARIKALGFPLWGGGILTEDLYNMRICKELGVKYALLETCFIDDADDMKFFEKNKNEMAAAVVEALKAVYN